MLGHYLKGIYVVVQFYPWFNFNFLLFFFMLIYDKEYQTKENQNSTKNNIKQQHIQHMLTNSTIDVISRKPSLACNKQ